MSIVATDCRRLYPVSVLTQLIKIKIIDLKEDILYILASLCDQLIEEVVYFT